MAGGWRAPAATVALLALAFPPADLAFLAPVALAPLGVWIAGMPSGGAALRGGFAFGAALWLVLLRWLPVTLGRFLPWALPGWLLVVAVLAAVTAAVVWAAHRLHRRAGAPLWLALPVAWTAGEFVRAHLPGPLAFPWLELSVTLTSAPAALGVAELVGSRGVGFLLALSGGLWATAWLAWREGATRRRERGPGDAVPDDREGRAAAVAPAAAALALAVVVVAWGGWRAATLPLRPGPTVAVVQTAVPQERKADRAAAADAGVADLERLLPRAAASRPDDAAGPAPDLVVFPEALLPVRVEGDDYAALRARVEAAVARAGVPTLVGALGVDARGPGPGDDVPYNSVFLVEPGGAVGDARYDKRHLVPVVERTPVPGLPWTGDGSGRAGGRGYGAGGTDAPLVPGALTSDGPDSRGWRVGVLVCLESAFSRAGRGRVRAGADLLVNPTNDAWLNGTERWARLSALAQHPAHLVVRAVETRTAAARAANTGLSLFVDPVGRSSGILAAFEEGVSVATLPVADVTTAFVRWGDLAGPLCFAGVLLALLVAGLRDRHTGRGEG